MTLFKIIDIFRFSPQFKMKFIKLKFLREGISNIFSKRVQNLLKVTICDGFQDNHHFVFRPKFKMAAEIRKLKNFSETLYPAYLVPKE